MLARIHFITTAGDTMDRNTLNEILKILPDDFGFKAVFEEPENEALKDSQVLILGIGKHKIEFTNGKYRPKNNDELKALCDIDSIELDDIDPSKVTDMSRIFDGSTRKDFSGIESWEVSQVKSMWAMFRDVHIERHWSWNISRWNVSSVEDMSDMFKDSSFNGDISRWNVGKVKNMNSMFWNSDFNQDISDWDISNVEDMSGMFAYSLAFNQDLNKWRVNPKADIDRMFFGTEALCILPKWDIELFAYSNYVFAGTIFDAFITRKIDDFYKQTQRFYPLTNRQLCNLTEREEIQLSQIDVSNITDMSCVFSDFFSSRKDFSGIESWNVSNVVNMYGMFYCNRWFNADISGWNVENVEDMENMFCGTEQFCHSLNEWNINNKVNIQGIFADTNYPKKYIKSWREKVGEEMFDKAFIKRVWQRK